MVADPFAEFSDALGLACSWDQFWLAVNTLCDDREDGSLTRMFMEEPGAFEVSSAEHVLASL